MLKTIQQIFKRVTTALFIVFIWSLAESSIKGFIDYAKREK